MSDEVKQIYKYSNITFKTMTVYRNEKSLKVQD